MNQGLTPRASGRDRLEPETDSPGTFWARLFLAMLSLPECSLGRVRSFSIRPGRMAGEIMATGESVSATINVDLLGPSFLSLWRRALRLAPGEALPGPEDSRAMRIARTGGLSPVPTRHAVLTQCACGRAGSGSWCPHVVTLAVTAAGHIKLDPARLWQLRGLTTEVAHVAEIGPGAAVAVDVSGRIAGDEAIGGKGPGVVRVMPVGTAAGTAQGTAQGTGEGVGGGIRAEARYREDALHASPMVPPGLLRTGPRVVAAPAGLRRMPVRHAEGAGGVSAPDAAEGRRTPQPTRSDALAGGPSLSMADFWGRDLRPDGTGDEPDPLLLPWTEEPRAITRLGPLPTARGQAASAEGIMEQYRVNRDLCVWMLQPPAKGRPSRATRRSRTDD